jgi:hypothetical protein
MITGLRASDAQTLTRLCAGDQRLFLRIGALMQGKLAFTEAALSVLLGREDLKKLIMDQRLRAAKEKDFQAMLSEAKADGEGLVLVVEDDWRVVALGDEVDNPLTGAGSSSVRTAVIDDLPLNAVVATLSPALREPVEGFLRANADDQRAAALEQLRYATPPLHVVKELMPMILADGAELVRERAIGLLVASGAHTAVIDLIRALMRNDHAGMQRHADIVSNLPAVQLDLVIAAVMAVAGRGQASQALVGICESLAEHLAHHPSLDRLIELLLPNQLSLVEFARAVQEHHAERLNSILQKSLGQGAITDVNIIILLAGPEMAGNDRLLDRGVELLLTPNEDPQERMALAGALRRLDQNKTLAKRIAAYGTKMLTSRDTTVYWLLAELCKDGAVEAKVANELAVTMRKLMREAPGPHLVTMLEQQLAMHLPASDENRASLVEPMGEIIARFRDVRTHELVAHAIVSIGAPAVPAAWDLLEDHPHLSVRELIAGVIPELLADANAKTALAAVDRLLDGLERAKQSREKAALVTAAARLVQVKSLENDPQPTKRVEQLCEGLGEASIDALGWIGAGKHIDPTRRLDVTETMLGTLMAELPDTPMQKSIDPQTDDATYVVDPHLGAHTENVPRLLQALYRIGASVHTPPQLLRRLVDQLAKQWGLVSTWKVVWGPGNVQELAKVLGRLAALERCPGPVKLRICEALVPRIGQLSVARILASVFATADGAYLSDLAGKSAEQLVKLSNDKYFADDEQEELCETLIDILAIPHLGANADSTRKRLAGVLGANRAHLPNRGRMRLRELTKFFNDDLKMRLEWV